VLLIRKDSKITQSDICFPACYNKYLQIEKLLVEIFYCSVSDLAHRRRLHTKCMLEAQLGKRLGLFVYIIGMLSFG